MVEAGALLLLLLLPKVNCNHSNSNPIAHSVAISFSNHCTYVHVCWQELPLKQPTLQLGAMVLLFLLPKANCNRANSIARPPILFSLSLSTARM